MIAENTLGAAIADPTLAQMHARPKLSVEGAETSAHRGMDLKAMRKVAEDFESVFLAEMMRPMFDGIEAEGPFSGGQAEEIWKNMQVDEYGKSIAKRGGIGIADAVMDQLIRMQEGAA